MYVPPLQKKSLYWYNITMSNDDGGCCSIIFGLVFFGIGIYVLYAIGGWVLSTFGIVGLIIYILLFIG